MKDLGLEMVSSSELRICGGSSVSGWAECIGKIATVWEFLKDYIPSLLDGLKKGWDKPVMIN